MRASVKLAGSKVMLRRRRRHRCSYWRRTITRLLGIGEIFKGNKPGNCQNEINSGKSSELYYADEQSGLWRDERRWGGRLWSYVRSGGYSIRPDPLCEKSRNDDLLEFFSLYSFWYNLYCVWFSFFFRKLDLLGLN